MKVKYLRGYDPAIEADVVAVVGDVSLGNAFLILRLSDGSEVEATVLEKQNGQWIASLPENW